MEAPSGTEGRALRPRFELDGAQEPGTLRLPRDPAVRKPDESVATVDGDGTVTARGNGVATIRAAASGVTGSADLVVRAGELASANGVGAESRPVPIDAGVTLHRINLGGGQVCGLMADGTAYCWANGFFGERGAPWAEGS